MERFMRFVFRTFRTVAILATLFSPVAAHAQLVDLELVIAVDISGSIDDDEAVLQRQGYIKALRHPAVIDAITRGQRRAIAVTYMEWAGGHHQRVLVPWTLVDSAKAANDVANMLEVEPISINVWTSISGAISGGVELFKKSPFSGSRRVIDVSGDGANNDGENVAKARDRAVAGGYIINGLPIVNDRPSRYGRRQIKDLDLYYADCVIGGPGAFLIVANGFDDYARAVQRKLILEIAALHPDDMPTDAPRMIPAAGNTRPSCNIGEMMRQHWDDL